MEFLKNENIFIDFSSRGILSNEEMKTTRLKSKIGILKNPKSSIRSFSSLIFLWIKLIFKL